MVAVIGDVHGCYYTLKQLVDKIKNKYPNIKIFCVGDLVDRGNFSYEVLEYVISEKIVFTAGNHDYMFYYYFKDPSSSMAKAWFHNGAEATLRSYENRMNKIEEHLNIVINAPLYIDHQDCFISHAGISTYLKHKLPENILGNLSQVDSVLKEDLYGTHSILWCRDKLINIGKLQIVGHTRRFETKYDFDSNVLYIDTAAIAKNKLSAAVLEKNNIVEIISVDTEIVDVSFISF